jgi:hypothetical protein
MLHDIKKLEGYAVGASDGELGTVKDMYFDDQHWAIRYLVVEAGGWLSGRKVLISPGAVIRVAWDEDTIDVRLTRQQVRDSPSIDTDKPVSRQHEMEFSDYYGYPYYWEGTYLWGPAHVPLPFGRTTCRLLACCEFARPRRHYGSGEGQHRCQA